MASFERKNIKALIRRLNVFQAWRLGEHPFENRGDLFSENDINSLLEDISSCLSYFAELPDNVKGEGSSKQQVRPPFGPMSGNELLKLALEESSKIEAAIKAGKIKPNNNGESFDNRGGFVVDV